MIKLKLLFCAFVFLSMLFLVNNAFAAAANELPIWVTSPDSIVPGGGYQFDIDTSNYFRYEGSRKIIKMVTTRDNFNFSEWKKGDSLGSVVVRSCAFVSRVPYALSRNLYPLYDNIVLLQVELNTNSKSSPNRVLCGMPVYSSFEIHTPDTYGRKIAPSSSDVIGINNNITLQTNYALTAKLGLEYPAALKEQAEGKLENAITSSVEYPSGLVTVAATRDRDGFTNWSYVYSPTFRPALDAFFFGTSYTNGMVQFPSEAHMRIQDGAALLIQYDFRYKASVKTSFNSDEIGAKLMFSEKTGFLNLRTTWYEFQEGITGYDIFYY